MSDNIVNSLKRLERAGSAASRASEKLFEAALDVAGEIEKNVENADAVGVNLPRGYHVFRQKSNIGSCLFLSRFTGEFDEQYGYPKSESIDGTGGYLHGDFHSEAPEATRESVLQFAKDVSEGLLDEIAEFLEKRTAVSDSATDKLNKSQVMA